MELENYDEFPQTVPLIIEVEGYTEGGAKTIIAAYKQDEIDL